MDVTSMSIEQNRRTGDEREQCSESPALRVQAGGFEINRIRVCKVMAQSHSYVVFVSNLNGYSQTQFGAQAQK
jgi:hypothetical protein